MGRGGLPPRAAGRARFLCRRAYSKLRLALSALGLFFLAISSLPLEAAAAINRPRARWLEGNLGHRAAARARGIVHFARTASAAKTAAAPATTGIAGCLRRITTSAATTRRAETLLGIKCLLRFGEGERGAAISTGERLLGHGVRLPFFYLRSLVPLNASRTAMPRAWSP